MAIVHVALKSSSSAPPSAAHADYIARVGQYKGRDDGDWTESGNMPDFAKSDPHAFWVAADGNERANGRTYTELQITLPRELDAKQRIELAQEAAREFMGDRFAYTMAIHTPSAQDGEEQPHIHLMFSERVIDERTRALGPDQFFKRNGAKKDRETWHARSKPGEVRVKWCEMANRALGRQGISDRLDPRSWADQGREDLAALVEPKELRGDGPKAVERREEIKQIRQLRKAEEELDREGEAQIAEIKTQTAEQRSVLDGLIQMAKNAAQVVLAKWRKLLGNEDYQMTAENEKEWAVVEVEATPEEVEQLRQEQEAEQLPVSEPVQQLSEDELLRLEVARRLEAMQKRMPMPKQDQAKRQAPVPQKKPEPVQEPKPRRIAVNLTREYLNKLVASQFPDDTKAQATAVYRITKGDSVTIMNERVNLDFDQDSKQFYASLDPDDKPALEKHLNRVLQKQQPAKSKPEKEKSEEIERD